MSHNMTVIDALFQNVSHRPWALPQGQWSYYQEWNKVLFLHWQVPTNELTKLIPDGISIDTYNGESWISLVAFTMEKIRPRNLPSILFVSDFHEINIRTYLVRDNKQGVYFINIEAEKLLSGFVARLLSGLPYEKATIARKQKNEIQQYIAHNKNKGFQLDATFKVGQKITDKSALDSWLTERYCLYLNENNKLYWYEIHHQPWELYHVDILNLMTNYTIGNISLSRKPDLAHYSNGVQVVAWQRENLAKH